MRTLLIDNYDSFTFNLFQLLAEVNGREPLVVRNDEAGWEELARLDFDNAVLSPGPGHPGNHRDFGVCAEAIARCDRPLLGVCLGHQGIGLAAGAVVEPAPRPVHGRRSPVEHTGAALFAGIPSRFEAVRYHSLCLRRPLPSCLEEIAVADDGVTMALAHRDRPQWGVQFHPESVASEHGRRLLENFRDLSAAGRPRSALVEAPRATCADLSPDSEEKSAQLGGAEAPSEGGASVGLELTWRRRPWVDPERAFLALYADSADAFWLDSSRPGPRARFSFMGDASGPLAARIEYDVDAGELTVRRGASAEVRPESVFAHLDRTLSRLRPVADAANLPFDFDCGFAGYLGYELKADCGADRAHSSPHPDAALIFADRLLAFDHEENDVYLLCLHDDGSSLRQGAPEGDAEAWLASTSVRLGELTEAPVQGAPASGASSTTSIRTSRSRDRYLADVATCRDRLRSGDSYEICLTAQLQLDHDGDPLALYRRLRRANPAPFSAYLRFGELAVLSSSPERFLRIGAGGGVEARPIKGTCRRSEDPGEDRRLAAALRASEKNRAENLMIADLMRNDLGSVCEVGSVTAPALMEVESYETVHQLVTTVRGRLRPEVGAAECVRACFPPGSMTGAPKWRAMEILDELEGAPRGVYSGAIGYLGLGGGCDLSVAIRAIVLAGGRASVGAGGAIVLGSEPEREHEEMLLKAAAALRAIDPRLEPASISLSDPRPAAV